MDGVVPALLPPPGGSRAFRLGARDAVIALLATFLVAASASRPEPAILDTIVTLPPVEVSRERASTSARHRLPTAFVTEIRAGESGHALETLSELLGQAASVRIVQYGGLGSFSTVSLRGAPAGEVTILLDGAPLTSAAHGVVSLADLPSTALERIEVYRGLSPLGLGVASPGGAINLVTLSSRELRELRLARGSFDTWEGRVTAAGNRRAFSGLFHLGYQGSRGDFSYHDDNGTPYNAIDDTTSRRLNNRFDAGTLIAGLTWEPRPGWRLVVREDAFHKAQGLPGLGAVPARHPRLELERSLSHLELSSATAGAWPELRLRGALNREITRFRDREAELGLGRHHSDDHVAGEQMALELEWPRLPFRVALLGAADLRWDRAFLHDALDGYPDPPESRRQAAGAAVGMQWRPLDGPLLLHAARRWERQADRLRSVGAGGAPRASDVTRESSSPQLGARVAGPVGLGLRANWTRAERSPDFLELFGNQGSVLGNAALRPEWAESWDAGGDWGFRRGEGWSGMLEGAHFESHARDLVVYMRNSQSSVRAQNVSRARIRGEELSWRLASPWGIAAAGSLTRLSARDEGPIPFWRGKRLPQRPERQGDLRLEAERGPLRVSADWQYLGENYLDPSNRQLVSARSLWGATLSVSALAQAVRVSVEGKNLGDERAADVGGFPLPGRSVFVAVETCIKPVLSGAR